jgi:hypothetical protein
VLAPGLLGLEQVWTTAGMARGKAALGGVPRGRWSCWARQGCCSGGGEQRGEVVRLTVR